MTRSRTLFGTILVALGVGCRQAEPIAPPTPLAPTIALEDVQRRLTEPGFFVYDANARELYERGHIPRARWVEWNHVAASDLPNDRGATVTFYCANEWCSASHEAARQAQARGYARVFVMSAGIYGWKKSGRPVDPP